MARVGFGEEADPGLWRFIHPGSKALIGIRWGKVGGTEVGQWMHQRWIGNIKMPGMEFLEDVDEILVSSPGVKSAANWGDEPPVLIAVGGRFDLTKIQALLIRLGAKKQMFGETPVYRQKGKLDSEPAFALVSSRLILMGDPQSLFSTIERSKLAASPDDGTFLARAKGMAERYDCWALLNDSGAMHNFLMSKLAGAAGGQESRGFEAGISVRDGLAIDVTVHTASERAAKAMESTLLHKIKLPAKAQTMGRGADELAVLQSKLKISVDRSNVAVSLRMDREELARSLVVSQPAMAGAARTNSSQPMVIRIEGLDEGPRTVPFKQ